ncbi:hypothetical protein QFZ74_003586 [Streptomyces sp. V3I7]|nr:hypothetical protein [Streptomyces sp. V3I7]
METQSGDRRGGDRPAGGPPAARVQPGVAHPDRPDGARGRPVRADLAGLGVRHPGPGRPRPPRTGAAPLDVAARDAAQRLPLVRRRDAALHPRRPRGVPAPGGHRRVHRSRAPRPPPPGPLRRGRGRALLAQLPLRGGRPGRLHERVRGLRPHQRRLVLPAAPARRDPRAVRGGRRGARAPAAARSAATSTSARSSGRTRTGSTPGTRSSPAGGSSSPAATGDCRTSPSTSAWIRPARCPPRSSCANRSRTRRPPPRSRRTAVPTAGAWSASSPPRASSPTRSAARACTARWCRSTRA